jgi:flavodoxin short chain
MGGTEKMARLIAKGVENAGWEAVVRGAGSASLDELRSCEVVVFGSPALGVEEIESDELAPAARAAAAAFPGKKMALFGSFGWGDGEWMRKWAAEMKELGASLRDDCLTVRESPEGEDAERCVRWGEELASSVS